MKVPPLALVFIATALMWFASAVTPAFDFTLPKRRLVSLSLGVIGAAVCISGIVSFRRAKTTINPMNPGSASSLVVSGIYRYTRNPMYFGLLVILFGWAVFLSNLTALVFLPVFVIYINRYQIGPEERALSALFGEEYRAYRSRVRRWI